MSTDKKLIITAAALLILLGTVGAVREYREAEMASTTPVVTMCTREAKICPDGSMVGRTGPNCEFAACPEITPIPSATSTSTSTQSGSSLLTGELIGSVTLGPTCPVMQNPPSPQCADKPYKTTVTVATNGREVGRQVTDAQGRFMFAFLPGTYTVTALGGNPLPRCNSKTVVLRQAATTTVELSCDTGIR